MPHVLGMPLQLAAAREQRLAVLDAPDEPLPARDDLERPIPFLEELHRMRDGPRLAYQIAGLAQLFDDDTSCFRRLKIRKLVVELLRACRIAGLPTGLAKPDLTERSVRQDDRPHWQRQLAPPGDVGDVAERADHGYAASLF